MKREKKITENDQTNWTITQNQWLDILLMHWFLSWDRVLCDM